MEEGKWLSPLNCGEEELSWLIHSDGEVRVTWSTHFDGGTSSSILDLGGGVAWSTCDQESHSLS